MLIWARCSFRYLQGLDLHLSDTGPQPTIVKVLGTGSSYHLKIVKCWLVLLTLQLRNRIAWLDCNRSTWLMSMLRPIFHIDGLVQERCNSSALAIELRLSCTNASISWKAIVCKLTSQLILDGVGRVQSVHHQWDCRLTHGLVTS